jgi:predicted DsbA family dithiol-disulfide isomerase
MAVVHISYHTDPACPWSWALEPPLRKLVNELGDNLQLTYVMGGMAKAFGDPEHLIGESLDASERSGMPVDARLWLDGAPRGSYAACIAVKAAAEQGCDGPYLRRLREGLMCAAPVARAPRSR